MNASDSLKETKRRRRLIWLWFPVGAILFFLILYPYATLVGPVPNWLILFLNIVWWVAYIVLRIWASRI